MSSDIDSRGTLVTCARSAPRSFPTAVERPVVIQTIDPIKSEPSENSVGQLVSILRFPPSAVMVNTTPIPMSDDDEANLADELNLESGGNALDPRNSFISGNGLDHGYSHNLQLNAGNEFNPAVAEEGPDPELNNRSTSQSISCKSARDSFSGAGVSFRMSTAVMAKVMAKVKAADTDAVVTTAASLATNEIEEQKARIFMEHRFGFGSLESLESLSGQLDKMEKGDKVEKVSWAKLTSKAVREEEARIRKNILRRKRGVLGGSDVPLDSLPAESASVNVVQIDSVPKKSLFLVPNSTFVGTIGSASAGISKHPDMTVEPGVTRLLETHLLQTPKGAESSTSEKGGQHVLPNLVAATNSEMAAKASSGLEERHSQRSPTRALDSVQNVSDVAEKRDCLGRRIGNRGKQFQEVSSAEHLADGGTLAISSTGEHLSVKVIDQKARRRRRVVKKCKPEDKPNQNSVGESNDSVSTEERGIVQLGANRGMFKSKPGCYEKGDFRCERCDFRTESRRALDGHRFMYEGFDCAEYRAFKCRACDGAFRHRRNWVRHERLHVVDGQGTISKWRISKKVPKKPCKSCGKLLSSLSQHHCTDKLMCEKCSKTFSTPSALAKHQALLTCEGEDDGPAIGFPCRWCPRTFPTRVARRAHTIRHTGLAFFKCRECGRRCSNPDDLRRHMAVGHATRRVPHAKHLCTICRKSVSSANVLRMHLMQHTGEKPFPCTLCDLRFPDAHQLKRHQLVHSDARPFACELCAKSYRGRHGLREHYSKHHQVERELNAEGLRRIGDAAGTEDDIVMEVGDLGEREAEQGEGGEWQGVDTEGVEDGILMEGCVELVEEPGEQIIS